MTVEGTAPHGLLQRIAGRLRRVLSARAAGEAQLREMVGLFGEGATPPEVLLFGDSVHERTSRDDSDLRPIGRMVADSLEGQATVAWICHSAYHAGVYLALSRVLEALSCRPRQVVVPINLRSFSPQWDKDPALACGDHVATYSRWLAARRRAAGPFQGADVGPTRGEFLRSPVVYPGGVARTVADMEMIVRAQPTGREGREQRWRDLFVYFQMQPIEPTHRKLQLLAEGGSLLASLGVQPLLYILPVNHEAGARWVGPGFGTAVRRNAGVVVDRLRQLALPGMRLEDWSLSLDIGNFFSDHDPTEHLNERGRAHVAKEIARVTLEQRR